MTVTFPTAAEFRGWLEAKPADEAIAERCNCYTCPLARCLESRGASEPAMRYQGWQSVPEHPDDLRDPKQAPDWAYDFMAAIDNADNAPDGDDAVTAAECLAALRRAAPEAFSDG